MDGDFTLGEWLIQPSVGRATRGRDPVHVRAKVMDLLVFLAQHPGEVVSKDMLLDGVWGTAALSESALTRSIAELRQAFGDDAERPNLLETIPKRGYRLIAPVHRRAAEREGSDNAEWATRDGPQQPQAKASHSRADLAAFVRRQRPLAWGLAAVGLLVIAGLAARVIPASAPDGHPPLVRFLMSPPEGTTFAAFPADPNPAVSPDGRQIATVARARDATYKIWIHSLDSLTAQPLAGTEGAEGPFWSPDGRFIGFFAQGKLKKIRLSGGPAETLCEGVALGMGATWSHSDVVLFAPNRASGLYRVPSSGGTPVAVTTLDASRQETSHRLPQFLPDGKHYIYLVRTNRPEHQGIFRRDHRLVRTETVDRYKLERRVRIPRLPAARPRGDADGAAVRSTPLGTHGRSRAYR